MTRSEATLPASYFDTLYASDPDPWKFATSKYERGKYSLTLSAFPRARYGRALEIGCSIGVLTRDLALRCDDLLAIDASAAPLQEARKRCADRPNVRFAQMLVPHEWPDGVFDLILLSEVVYYLDTDDVSDLAGRVTRSLRKDSNVVLVHWTGATNYPLSGDEACETFIDRVGPEMKVERSDRYGAFRLDVLVKR